MRVAITGANGLLGGALLNVAKLRNFESVPLARDERDFALRLDYLVERIRKTNANVVVHCAAYTNVEACEHDVEKCYRDNYLLTDLVAQACAQLQMKMVYISSTGIYGAGKTTPYREFDEVAPTTAHHHSKWLGEKSVQQYLVDALIIRTGWLFGGGASSPKNFVFNRIKEARASDSKLQSDASQYGCPTYVNDVVDTILELLEGGFSGVFNCVNSGGASRFEYVKKIVEFAGIDIEVEPVDGSRFKRVAKVSANESADNFKLCQLGLNSMPHWEESLKKYIELIVEK